jgi:predicted nucleic acid-binding protein
VNGYLFDTCTVRKWYGKHAPTVTFTEGLPDEFLIYVSVITIGEIECGHLGPTATDAQQQQDFRKWIRETFEVPQLSITAATAIEYAKFRRVCFDKLAPKYNKFIECREDMLGKKLGIDENDLWLVAQASERNLTFVTNDKMNRLVQAVGGAVPITFIPDT